MGKTALTLGAALLCIGTAAAAETWYVDGSVPESGDGKSWQTAFAKVQEGIDAASEGDTVTVAQGTYIENIEFKGKNITLTSTDPLDPSVVANTVIDGNSAGSVVTFAGTEDETCALLGFTVQRGYAYRGGGVTGAASGTATHATIKNNRIIGNQVEFGAGGGLAFCDGLIAKNTIAGNSAWHENVEGGGLYDCDGTIESNEISRNWASAGNWPFYKSCGGALSGCDGTIRGNIISRNHAEYAGALYRCDALIEGNIISDNCAEDSGGGLGGCNGTIVNNVIVGNRANPYQAPLTGSGGGLDGCSAQMTNNTVAFNSASSWGGGASGSCAKIISNSIFWGNTAPRNPQLDCSQALVACHVQGRSCGYEWNPAGDPMFVDPENGDFRLRPGSPCIDAGFPVPGLPETDIAGMHRIMFGGRRPNVDIGAYEFYLNRVEPLPGTHQVVLTWSSVVLKTYCIFYSDDLLGWHVAVDSFPFASGRTTSWTDDGSLTGVPPLLVPRRFYRLLENP